MTVYVLTLQLHNGGALVHGVYSSEERAAAAVRAEVASAFDPAKSAESYEVEEFEMDAAP